MSLFFILLLKIFPLYVNIILGYFSTKLLDVKRSKDTIKEHLTELSNNKKLIKLYEVSNHPKQADPKNFQDK